MFIFIPLRYVEQVEAIGSSDSDEIRLAHL